MHVIKETRVANAPIFIDCINYLGVAGAPLLPAQVDSPTLSIHVPQLCTLPPYTNPVPSSTPTSTLNPGGVISRSRLGPAPLSLKAVPWACLCRMSCTTSARVTTCWLPKSAWLSSDWNIFLTSNCVRQRVEREG